MLIRKQHLQLIQSGGVDLAFRRWKKPTVKRGGSLRTALGVLSIDGLETWSEDEVTEADARRAGYADRQAILDELARHEGTLYRIELSYLGEDPRILLRESSDLSENELREIEGRLARLDRASNSGPWTLETLRIIQKNPRVLAAHLAESQGVDKAGFKRNVRKLKNLGLTQSHRIGYSISPRGRVVLQALDSNSIP